jgi:protein gp37/ParB-like chromosome segregation protein Spo0J
VARLGPYEVHPFADKFPLITGEEFDELVADIREHGLREPILLSSDGRMLIDGRNRYRACEKAGSAPRVQRIESGKSESEVLSLIVSLNIERRHLNPGQLGLLALDLESAYAEAAKAAQAEAGRQRAAAAERDANGLMCSNQLVADRPQAGDRTGPQPSEKSRDRAARAVGASGRSVQRAKALQRDTPDLADKVRRGEIALDKADRERREWVRAQPKPEPAPRPAAVMLTLRTHEGAEVLYPRPSSKATFNETKGEGISWAAWSWNPVTGCLHGCTYCYARAIADDDRYKAAYPAGFTPLFHSERLDAPANTTIPVAYRDESHAGCANGACKICAYRRVFVCSMADLYGRWVPDEWIAGVHKSMLATPDWEYLLLTKFPARYVGLDLPPNAWVGTSVDEQKRVRIAENAFRQIDGVKVKWLSLEPLREPLEFTDLSMFDWVVIGAQTETRQPDGVVPAFAPPFEWVARIAIQALDAGCKVHMKPNLRSGPGLRWLDEYPAAQHVRHQPDLFSGGD